MKRGALVFAIVALLLLADGSYLQVTNDQVGGDTGNFFGNQNINLSAGTVVLISGGLLLVGAAVMWTVAIRRGRRNAGGQRTRVSRPAGGSTQPQVAAGQAQAGKESGDQR